MKTDMMLMSELLGVSEGVTLVRLPGW